MCKTSRIGKPAGAPPEGTPPADDVNIENNNGLRVTRSSLVNGLGFRRSSPQMLSQNTFGESVATRFGFPAVS
jgi:hypothetical protein